jgi:hypothetical protein
MEFFLVVEAGFKVGELVFDASLHGVFLANKHGTISRIVDSKAWDCLDHAVELIMGVPPLEHKGLFCLVLIGTPLGVQEVLCYEARGVGVGLG